jgi:hypothetical protein
MSMVVTYISGIKVVRQNIGDVKNLWGTTLTLFPGHVWLQELTKSSREITNGTRVSGMAPLFAGHLRCVAAS